MRKKHRMRLINEFLLNDIDNFEEYEILELLLFYALPMKDTASISIELLKVFGSINKVLDSPIRVLTEVYGIGKSTAIYIKLLSSVSRFYLENKYIKKEKVLSLKELIGKLSIKFISRMEEVVVVVLLDANGKLIYCGTVYKGGFNLASIYIRKIIELIMLYNANSIIIAHNHLNGSTTPSLDDIKTIKKLNTIFKSLNINFLDSIIVSNGKYFSFRDSGFNDLF